VVAAAAEGQVAPSLVAREAVGKLSVSAQRKEAVQRRRRIIFNNDGNDAVYFPTNLAPTDENLLSLRTTPLLNTHVDTISYCTNRGIGLVIHRSTVNQVLDGETREKSGAYADKRNIVGDLHRRGTDSLKIMAQFCRAHGKELFWSMRMNDIHDASNGTMLSTFKKQHPHFLFGSPQAPPPYRGYSGLWGGNEGVKWGGYSGVDYGEAEVRKLVFETVAEVCRNYDIDGVELDFCRSPVLFKSHAWNREVTAQERADLTQMLGNIRAMAEDVAVQRGRPLLIAVRVPDSAAYCHSIGIELEKWLADGLLDILIPGADFLLSSWKVSVDLAHRHGVAVYPSITRAPTSANPGYGERSAPECYRGRALRAWDAGGDGLYLFNIFLPNMPFLKELGDPKVLRGMGRVYYGSEMPTWHARVSHARGLDFRTLPLLSPEHPQKVLPGPGFATTILVPEDLAGSEPGKFKIRLGMKFAEQPRRERLEVSLNGHALNQPSVEKEWLEYEVRPDWTVHGDNEVGIVIGRGAEGDGSAPEFTTITDIRVSVTPKGASS
jgi:hypothetical protein